MRGGLGRRTEFGGAALVWFAERLAMATESTVTAFVPGAAVILADDIPAKVLSVQLRVGGSLAYECAWWDGNVRHAEWVEPHEVKAGKGEKPLRLGFVPPEGA